MTASVRPGNWLPGWRYDAFLAWPQTDCGFGETAKRAWGSA
jgi:hypothetical protein